MMRAQKGPLQKCLRYAGLPETPEALDLLEQLARATSIPGQSPSVKDMRRAARLYRKQRENPKRRATPIAEGMTKNKAEKVLRTAHGLKSGRQWVKWKKAQRRLQPSPPTEVSDATEA